ncbi:hypothetical protein [Dyadobacter chenhuakuii]|uniref:Uncharacterized protein n=1 Tax=Dyadobacter chenhuakuii TaxID=2909339 RepID=A0ABY4XP88_9BACT|nr:hypothetical protein [Dyadobacter chenhuakuii]MCF2494592.1 hypothetical protein [Dyadobacter chenhuakuii]USJ32086.1 hypothetical protein NFI80_04945 [Dyadobacter chenhuakuii]
MNTEQDMKRDLEERILSKRQQIEFERKNLSLATEFSQENRENPEVMEESKNFDDPAESVLDTDEVKALRTTERDLNELIKQLQELNKG